MAEQIFRGGTDASHALRLLELQVLTQLAASGVAQRGRQLDDPLGLHGPVLSGADAADQSRGFAAIRQLDRNVQRWPEQVVRAFNAAIQRELETDVTGMP